MKKILTCAFVFILFVSFLTPLYALAVNYNDTTPMISASSSIALGENERNASLPRIVDNADILTSKEEADLEKRILNIIELYNFDVVFVTENNVTNTRDFADDFYDNNGYGIGPNHDGVLVLVSGENRWISGCGSGVTIFSSYSIDYIGKRIAPKFDNGDYFQGYNEFLDYSEEFLKQADTGTPYSANNSKKSASDVLIPILVCIGGSAIIALIIIMIMKQSMKTAKPQHYAQAYIKSGSFNLTERNDVFLYDTISRTAKPEPSSNSGSGSSGGSHTSSSGTTHSGGSF